jgi:hypothetical protein
MNPVTNPFSISAIHNYPGQSTAYLYLLSSVGY